MHLRRAEAERIAFAAAKGQAYAEHELLFLMF